MLLSGNNASAIGPLNTNLLRNHLVPAYICILYRSVGTADVTAFWQSSIQDAQPLSVGVGAMHEQYCFS